MKQNKKGIASDFGEEILFLGHHIASNMTLTNIPYCLPKIKKGYFGIFMNSLTNFNSREITNTVNQTPIEIALGIDANGMTTAKRLYKFLGMDNSNYSRWFKNNITINEFAEENVDYFPFVINDECGGQASQDARLTASFAKKLSMMSKSEKGEQARQYFVKVEDSMKELATSFYNISPELRAVLVVDQRVTKIEQKTDGLRQDFETFKKDLPVLGIEESKITNAVRKKGIECLGGKGSNAYKDKSLRGRLYSDLHRQLKREFGVSTYKAIKRNQCDLALKVIETYVPPIVLEEQIKDTNAQMNLEVA